MSWIYSYPFKKIASLFSEEYYYYNLLKENYYHDWKLATFESLPIDSEGKPYASWKETYNNYMILIKIPRFSNVPQDIFDLTILFIPFEKIPHFISSYCKSDPKACSPDKNFWKLLWKRDINENPPEDAKEKYLNFIPIFMDQMSIQLKFYQAVKFGAIKLLPHLFARGVDITILDYLGLALIHGHADIVKYLISLGADDSKFSYENFLHAIIRKHLNMVKYFIEERGIDISNKKQILAYAISTDNLDIVKYLISIGASVSENNYFSLRYAKKDNHKEIFYYLLSQIPDFNAIPVEILNELEM